MSINIKERLNQFFFQKDYMNTCCVENDLFDEYRQVTDLFLEDFDFTVFEEFFGIPLTDEQEEEIANFVLTL